MSDEALAFVAPYPALVREDARQREHSQREVSNALRYLAITASGRASTREWSPPGALRIREPYARRICL